MAPICRETPQKKSAAQGGKSHTRSWSLTPNDPPPNFPQDFILPFSAATYDPMIGHGSKQADAQKKTEKGKRFAKYRTTHFSSFLPKNPSLTFRFEEKPSLCKWTSRVSQLPACPFGNRNAIQLGVDHGFSGDQVVDRRPQAKASEVMTNRKYVSG